MKKYIGVIIYAVYGLFISGLGIYLCFHWFGWKLFVVLILLIYGNNLANKKI